MSGRVCLFCEKPLSRIRVGGGEDFCSREHRNHYRLRRGMDQLQAANQMATLMRRRENPKPLATVVPAGDGANLQRGFPAPVASNPRVEIAFWRPGSLVPASQPVVAIPLDSSCFSRLGLPCAASTEPRRLVLKRLSFSGQIAGGLVHRVQPRPAGLERCVRQQSVFPPPSRGAALRVSLPVGFRRLRMETRRVTLEPLVTVAASRAGDIRPVAPADIAAAAREMLLKTGLFHAQVRCPRPPGFQSANGIRPPGGISLLHAGEIDCPVKFLQVGWAQKDPITNFVVPKGAAGTLQPQRFKARVFVLANAPVRGERTQRIAAMPFLSQDVPFGFAEEESHKR